MDVRRSYANTAPFYVKDLSILRAGFPLGPEIKPPMTLRDNCTLDNPSGGLGDCHWGSEGSLSTSEKEGLRPVAGPLCAFLSPCPSKSSEVEEPRGDRDRGVWGKERTEHLSLLPPLLCSSARHRVLAVCRHGSLFFLHSNSEKSDHLSKIHCLKWWDWMGTRSESLTPQAMTSGLKALWRTLIRHSLVSVCLGLDPCRNVALISSFFMRRRVPPAAMSNLWYMDSLKPSTFNAYLHKQQRLF